MNDTTGTDACSRTSIFAAKLSLPSHRGFGSCTSADAATDANASAYERNRALSRCSSTGVGTKRLTPKGRSVSARTSAMPSASWSPVRYPPGNSPKPPASLIAAARSGVPVPAIGAPTTGNFERLHTG